MVAPLPSQPHDRCTHRGCVQWSGLFPAKENGSENVSGVNAEILIARRLHQAGISAALKPSGAWTSPDEKGIRPDLGMWIPVDGDDDEHSGSVGALFALGESKLQMSNGTAYQKVDHALRRYGHLSDQHDLTVIVFHMMCPAVVGRGTLAELELLATQHRVGWIGFDDISAARVRRVAADLAEQRARRVTQARLAELVAELGLAGVGDLARYAIAQEARARKVDAQLAAMPAEDDTDDQATDALTQAPPQVEQLDLLFPPQADLDLLDEEGLGPVVPGQMCRLHAA